MAARESSSRFLSRLGCLCSLLISRFFLYELKMFYYVFEGDRFRLFFQVTFRIYLLLIPA